MGQSIAYCLSSVEGMLGRVEVENRESGIIAVENIENMESLIQRVRQIAYEVHEYLGNGYLEKVYENCLRHRLEKAGYKVEAQKPLPVYDVDGFLLGDYFADLFVEGRLIVELKATKGISAENLAQTMNYLKIGGQDVALVINFGSYQFETRKVFAPKHG